ncbi:hypothetical protein F5Y17DRAFT_458528 [Xylariaceae sp. FL0594]|nr:hypothetical protein F5Y17DRAFT_458528 [Xylariaceae sp. FL0594]
MVHFQGNEYRSHTSCITEDQKYQGALYKPKKQKPNSTGTTTAAAAPAAAPAAVTNQAAMAHHAYVEDAADDIETYQTFNMPASAHVNGVSYTDAPITAPALPEDANLNVFDYMLDPTPNVSTVNLIPQQTPSGGRQLVRFEQNPTEFVDESGYMVDDAMAYQTPAPKAHRKKSKDSEQKKDKKRKRLHIETSPGALDRNVDEDMTDAPPVLHSGLTGGLKSMMRPSQFPPSPDYSGGDNAVASPASPIKKKKTPKKSTKAARTDSFLKALVAGPSKTKVSKKRRHSPDSSEKKSKSRSSSSKKKDPKLIEYKTRSEEKADQSGAMIVYRPRSDLFLSLCTKGPESDRGYSVNKALKRFHRERSESGTSLGKTMEEKELWRSLRMRRNERGEIVLFSLEE